MSLALLIAFQVNADTLEDQIAEISGELMCPVCEGQSVAESNAQLAQDMRAIIRTKLLEGNTKEEVIDYFISSYGETILAPRPEDSAPYYGFCPYFPYLSARR